jgi:hypothetical protein
MEPRSDSPSCSVWPHLLQLLSGQQLSLGGTVHVLSSCEEWQCRGVAVLAGVGRADVCTTTHMNAQYGCLLR